MTQPELTTERLVLRSFSLNDAGEVQKLAGNFSVSKTTLNIPYPYESGMAEDWIGTHLDKWTTKTGVVYAIATKDTGQLVGAISLVELDGVQGELGYWVGEPYWGKGYCTEAAKAIIQFAFGNLDLKKFIAEHLKSNPASGKVMQKANMYHYRTIKKADRDGKKVDIKVYEIQNT